MVRVFRLATLARPQHQIVVDRITVEAGKGSLGRHSRKRVVSVLRTRGAIPDMPLRHWSPGHCRIKRFDRTAYDLAAASGGLFIDSGGPAALDGPKPMRTLMSPPFDCPAAP
jgi:hypothetical protein